jgi:hypothetical protein
MFPLHWNTGTRLANTDKKHQQKPFHHLSYTTHQVGRYERKGCLDTAEMRNRVSAPSITPGPSPEEKVDAAGEDLANKQLCLWRLPWQRSGELTARLQRVSVWKRVDKPSFQRLK